MTLVRVTMQLDEEDIPNIHLALGLAVAALFDGVKDRELATRAQRRLEALHVALSAAEVCTIAE